MRKLFYLLLISSLFSGCVQLLPDAPESPSPYLDYMPERTTEGNNTFGCYEDGKLVAVQGLKQQEASDWAPPLPLVSARQLKTESEIIFQLNISPKDDWSISVQSLNIKQGINHSIIIHNHKSGSEQNNYYRTLDSVDVNITFIDESKHIVCGEFDKVILHSDHNTEETITLTNGQFDVKCGVYKY